jgi:hypothetical protein
MSSKSRTSAAHSYRLSQARKLIESITPAKVQCRTVLIDAPVKGAMNMPSLCFQPRNVDGTEADMPRKLQSLAEVFNRRVKALSVAGDALIKRNVPFTSPAWRSIRRRYRILSKAKYQLIRRAEVLYQEACVAGEFQIRPPARRV